MYIKMGTTLKLISSYRSQPCQPSHRVCQQTPYRYSNLSRNLVIGCVYRHHTGIPIFLESFFKNALEVVSRQPNKICTLMGDFNIDLIRYASENNTGAFYDLCSYSFRLLILQPTRVTSKTVTLIDNICINDISCRLIGGNVTSSISDHFFQFSIIDILPEIG